MADEEKYGKLSEIPKKDIFRAPEGYFDSLQERIEGRMAGHSPRGKMVGLNTHTFRYVALAVAAAVTLLIVFLPSRQIDPASPSAAELISQISDEDCLAFLQTSEVEIDDILGLPEPALWNEVIEDPLSDTGIEDDEDLMYEHFGVSEDKDFQLL